ncbi:MAG: SDR family NAD(P)-dependent oxidoreductase, partial [Betaproteobacteria bacterium]|nr:SDR family NAD(P)-dependent oxidoreductase [Betaproteobacteria bacterium]
MTADTLELRGRYALVSGAGSGIGLATVRALLAHGAKVAAVVQSDPQRGALAGLLPAELILVQDLLNDAACAALPALASERLGGLDALACCAGIFYKKGSDDTRLEEWRHTLALNLDATFILTRAAIASMRAKRRGDAAVVVISSQIGLVGHVRGAAYAASKA